MGLYASMPSVRKHCGPLRRPTRTRPGCTIVILQDGRPEDVPDKNLSNRSRGSSAGLRIRLISVAPHRVAPSADFGDTYHTAPSPTHHYPELGAGCEHVSAFSDFAFSAFALPELSPHTTSATVAAAVMMTPTSRLRSNATSMPTPVSKIATA